VIYEIEITFGKGATVKVYAQGYKMYWTGHHGNKSGKVFEINDYWYAEGSPKITSIDVDEIVCVTQRETPRGWVYGGA
jgi:hypothetical protein